MSKSEFIRSLQGDSVMLTPYEISQRIRKRHSCVSTYMGDAELKIEHYRGYMLRYPEAPNKTPENPQHYVCVISLKQSKQWQDLVWTKEILGILDGPDHWTSDKALLGHMLDSRGELLARSTGTPLNVLSDRNGLTLALGCTIPFGYRRTLRDQHSLAKFDTEQLESIIMVPAELIEWLLNLAFEEEFERALQECDHEEAVRASVG
jgi:hypothetical protein